MRFSTGHLSPQTIFVFNAGRETWAQFRILDPDSTSIARQVQVLENFMREVIIGKIMVPILYMNSSRRMLRMRGGGKGKGDRRIKSDC